MMPCSEAGLADDNLGGSLGVLHIKPGHVQLEAWGDPRALAALNA